MKLITFLQQLAVRNQVGKQVKYMQYTDKQNIVLFPTSCLNCEWNIFYFNSW